MGGRAAHGAVQHMEGALGITRDGLRYPSCIPSVSLRHESRHSPNLLGARDLKPHLKPRMFIAEATHHTSMYRRGSGLCSSGMSVSMTLLRPMRLPCGSLIARGG